MRGLAEIIALNNAPRAQPNFLQRLVSAGQKAVTRVLARLSNALWSTQYGERAAERAGANGPWGLTL